jgi:hypothetical protein
VLLVLQAQLAQPEPQAQLDLKVFKVMLVQQVYKVTLEQPEPQVCKAR